MIAMPGGRIEWNSVFAPSRGFGEGVWWTTRFPIADTFEGVLNDPQSLHKYLYVHGDPVNHVDPTGMFLSISFAGLAGRASMYAANAAASTQAMWLALGPAVATMVLHDTTIGSFNTLKALATGEDEYGEPLTGWGYLWYGSMAILDFLPGKVADAFEKLVDYRRTIGFPTSYTGQRTVDGVTALLRIDGQEFLGHNGWIRRTGRTLEGVLADLRGRGVRPNRRTPTHAEGQVFYDAVISGARARSAELFIDGPFCDACGQNRGLRAYAEGLGVEELIVYMRLPDGRTLRGSYNLTPVSE